MVVVYSSNISESKQSSSTKRVSKAVKFFKLVIRSSGSMSGR